MVRFAKIMWLVSAVFTVIGALTFIGLSTSANSALQEAVAAGIGLALAVIPYCFARAISELSIKDASSSQTVVSDTGNTGENDDRQAKEERTQWHG